MTHLSLSLADTIIARYPDALDLPYKRWCYVHGYVLLGFERLYDATGNRKYLDYLLRWAEEQVAEDGSIPRFTGESLDDMMAGTAIVAAWQKTGALMYRRAAETIRGAFADYPRNSDRGFWHGRELPHQMWVDGVFMGQMFLTRYGAAIGDGEYCFGETVRQIGILADRCRKADTGLFLHGYDESKKAAWADPVTGLSPEVWSEGLGWYALVLVETAALLPKSHAGREGVLRILAELLAGLKKAQDGATGLWYQVVDKGDRPGNWHDTSGSAMFLYTFQRAIDLGYASRDSYAQVVKNGYAGILRKARTGKDGRVDILDACDGLCVQGSYEDYVGYPRVINAKEAVASVLWATAIVEKPGRDA